MSIVSESARPPRLPRIVIKLDDVFHHEGRLPERWQRVVSFAESRNLKISAGVICNSLEGDHPRYFAELRRQVATGLVELWHHGYDHARWTEGDVTYCEFRHTDRAHQLDHLVRAQRLAKEKLGVTFTTFGAPYNATDDTTVELIGSSMPEIRVWLHGDIQKSAGKFIGSFVPAVSLEKPAHKPNYPALVEGFEAERGKGHRFIVLQGHPHSWDDNAFAEFVRIVDFLVAQGCLFIHPSELPELFS